MNSFGCCACLSHSPIMRLLKQLFKAYGIQIIFIKMKPEKRESATHTHHTWKNQKVTRLNEIISFHLLEVQVLQRQINVFLCQKFEEIAETTKWTMEGDVEMSALEQSQASIRSFHSSSSSSSSSTTRSSSCK